MASYEPLPWYHSELRNPLITDKFIYSFPLILINLAIFFLRVFNNVQIEKKRLEIESYVQFHIFIFKLQLTFICCNNRYRKRIKLKRKDQYNFPNFSFPVIINKTVVKLLGVHLDPTPQINQLHKIRVATNSSSSSPNHPPPPPLLPLLIARSIVPEI